MKEEIIKYILSNTDLRTFNYAIENYNIQVLYERLKNYLIRTYFNGDVLKFSVTLRKYFNDFQTTKQEQEARSIYSEMYFLKKKINSKKKYKLPYSDEAKEYNKLSEKLNLLNSGINDLVKLYKKYRNK